MLTLSATAALPPSSPAQNVKRTYAQMRTIRREADITLALGQAPIEATDSGVKAASPSRFPVRASYTELRAKFGPLSDGSEAEAGEEDGFIVSIAASIDECSFDQSHSSKGSQVELASINQARSAGENRRFSDEICYVLDGLHATQSLNVQRTR